ncbi:MAG: hypothetical protein CVU04_03260 [Bacteroidetes bacterium HGW-Bacteroidetes-20]|nr:MAG: hypothetical protein CVU04_03260 [Bacteroidetes bacterium HGW-Bacteroidetes-20]
MKKHFLTIAYDLIMLILIIMVLLKVFAVSSANWYITLLPLFVILFMKLFVLVKEVIKDLAANLVTIYTDLWIIQSILIVLKLIQVSELHWVLTIIPLCLVFILKSIIFITNYAK